jgi:hypothetical protein
LKFKKIYNRYLVIHITPVHVLILISKKLLITRLLINTTFFKQKLLLKNYNADLLSKIFFYFKLKYFNKYLLNKNFFTLIFFFENFF